MSGPLRDRRGAAGRLPESPGAGRIALALLYGLGARCHAAWPRRRVRTAKPLVSVGALEVGGVGKTPAVAALAVLLAAAGWRPGVLTGHAGQARGRRLLAAGEPGFDAAAPDEAALLAARLSGLPLVAARRKWEGARRLDADPRCDLILLDDGFQHHRLARTLDLVLLSADAPLRAARVLPAGPLRERPSALARADAFLLPEGAPRGDLPERPVFRFTMVVESTVDLAGRPVDLAGERCLAVAAIARPERFERTAAGLCRLVGRLRFRDHRLWDAALRRELAAALAANDGAQPLLTEKDAARWGRHWDLPGPAPAVIRVALRWSDPAGLRRWIAGRLGGA
ncbi:MAG: tetraacyldisaccharide 4'-kinase [Candidatus Krumholzibacteriota bacterium]|nr:tetraacyldisaccharide 4'-kinase [Candidatus Krumholzibacteriota bacterium]